MLGERLRYAVLLKYFLVTMFWTLPLAVYRLLKYRQRTAQSHSDDPYGIVCISHVPWSSAWQRNHHTMYDLSKRHKVLYCHPVVICGDRLDFLSTNGSERRAGHGNDNLVVIEPLTIRGERVLPWVRAINKIILVAAIKKITAGMNMGPRILWFYSPLNEYLAGSLDELLTVYDIQDEYAGFLGRPEHVREMEGRLLRKADLVFTGTYALYETKRKHNQNIHFVPCGVDAAHFGKARIGNLSLPEDIKSVEHPIVGYFGRVCSRMDTELLAWMADLHPEWSIVLIGEVIEHEFPLKKKSNILLLGQKSYADLPQYVQAFDVCMIPFRLNELTLNVNPTKLLEYLAAGKPVVSTAIPDMVRFYGNVIDIGRNKDEFTSAVERILQENKAGASEAVKQGMAIAEASDWAATIAKMESFIMTDIKRKRSVRCGGII
jgi:glycosyltransferase involved in cell wall biosynthesis